MNNNTKLAALVSLMLTLPVSRVNALQSIEEESLRNVSGQSGVDIDLNFEGTIGRTYFETQGNSLNMRNINIDTDGVGDGSGVDRPLNMVLDLVTRGEKSGLAISISGINDMDITLDQINVNGDDTAGAILNQNNSYGGLALTNINDHGGVTDINIFARGASGEEGVQIEMNLPEILSLDLAYTDYGADNNVSTDDFVFGGELTLNNFTAISSVDLTSGTNDAGEKLVASTLVLLLKRVILR
eukprot:TRINITY_DN5854_c0_g1_i1.p1 TRINITY_DN5854_c0_g1~~TRINITY_DN5854_c0_g1_i1.p1  ORF type:complete len:242 (-),score=62.37 TRINITY_DN5854_c0_g1_i1:138-863(-)